MLVLERHQIPTIHMGVAMLFLKQNSLILLIIETKKYMAHQLCIIKADFLR